MTLNYKYKPFQKCLNSKKNIIKVSFLFSSFIAADVKQSLKEFQNFLILFSDLFHQRVWNKKYEILKTKNINKNIHSPTPCMSQLQIWNSKQNEKSVKPLTIAKKIIWEIKSYDNVKTIHDHGSLKAKYQFPRSTVLKTVLRSPHVFKKSREQFGMFQCIISHDIYFLSHNSAQLFINCVSMLKFPVEVQILLSSGIYKANTKY